MGARLACKEKHHKHGKKHHVARKPEEDKETNAMKQLARSLSRMPPVVIAAPAPTARRPSINRGFAAYSRFFPFRFRRGVREGRGHFRASVNLSILSLRFGRIRKQTGGSAFFYSL
ncbi:MAG TPA: hypothetical protein VL967_11350 [Terracidiphilus sp.]|nr:hypothetical protein [Terracidiphilus sp.]